MNFPIAEPINQELRRQLDELLARGDETEYIRGNPILRDQIVRGRKNYEQGRWLVPTLKQLGLEDATDCL